MCSLFSSFKTRNGLSRGKDTSDYYFVIPALLLHWDTVLKFTLFDSPVFNLPAVSNKGAQEKQYSLLAAVSVLRNDPFNLGASLAPCKGWAQGQDPHLNYSNHIQTSHLGSHTAFAGPVCREFFHLCQMYSRLTFGRVWLHWNCSSDRKNPWCVTLMFHSASSQSSNSSFLSSLGRVFFLLFYVLVMPME